jgi:hypothetical protein
MERWAERARRLKTEMVALSLAVRFVPAPVLADCRSRASEIALRRRLGRRGWLLLAAVWLALAAVGVAIAL